MHPKLVCRCGERRVLTGILTSEARQALGRQIEADTIEQMERIKFIPRNACGAILHKEAIKQCRIRLRADLTPGFIPFSRSVEPRCGAQRRRCTDRSDSHLSRARTNKISPGTHREA